MLPARQREQCSADRSERLDEPAVHAAVHDPISLQVLGPGDELRAHLVLGRERDRDPHRLEPALGHLVETRRVILAHDA